MVEGLTEDIISQIIDRHESGDSEYRDNSRGGQIAIWLPADLKAKYDQIQDATGSNFTKALKEILKLAIERKHSKIRKDAA